MQAMENWILSDAERARMTARRQGGNADSGQRDGSAGRSVKAASLGNVRHHAVQPLRGVMRACASMNWRFDPSERWTGRRQAWRVGFLPGVGAGACGAAT